MIISGKQIILETDSSYVNSHLEKTIREMRYSESKKLTTLEGGGGVNFSSDTPFYRGALVLTNLSIVALGRRLKKIPCTIIARTQKRKTY